MTDFADDSNISLNASEEQNIDRNALNGNNDNEMTADDNSKTEDELDNNDLNDSNDKSINLSKANDDEDRKLFIGGLNWETNDKDLKEYFTKYGTVVDVSIKFDAVSGNPRGFGFITFAAEDSIEEVLKSGPHVICGKAIDPKRAKSRPICKKIFVGGIDSNMTEEEIKKYFQKFGSVEGIELPFDRQRNRRREFCFIIFDTEEAAELAVKEAKQTIGTKECDIKKAQPQPVAQQQKRLQQQTYSYDGTSGQRRGGGTGGRRGQTDHYQSQGNWSGYNGAVAQNYYGNYYGNQYPNAYGYPNQTYDYYNQYGYSYGDYWNYYGYGDTTGAVAGDYSQAAVDTTATYGTSTQPTSQSSSHSHTHHSSGSGSAASAGKMLRKSGSSSSNYHPYRS